MKSLSYSIDHYISKGFSHEDALKKVEDNKNKTSIGLIRKLAEKRIGKWKILTGMTVDEVLALEQRISEFTYFGKHPAQFYPKLEAIMDARSVGLDEAVEIVQTASKIFAKQKRLASSTEFIKYVYGETSDVFQNRLRINLTCASCSFEKFSADYDDKELAYKLFCEKYGSNNANHLKKKFGDDIAIAEEKKRRNILSKETFSKKSVEEIALISSQKGLTLDNYIRRYGEILGTVKYTEEIAKRQGRTNLAWYIEKYGDVMGSQKYRELKGKHNAIYCWEYWVHRGETEHRAKEIVAKMFSERPNFSREYCAEKYGVVRGDAVWRARNELWQSTLKNKPKEEIDRINSLKGITIDRMQDKYGVEEGLDRYNTWLAAAGGNSGRVSTISIRFFLKLYKKLRRLGLVDSKYDIKLGVDGIGEYYINLDGTIRFYDFTILSKKLIIEYNGHTWHPREGDLTWKNPHGVDYATAIGNDRYKLELATRRGFKLMYVWDDEDENEELMRSIMFVMENEKE